MRQTLEQRAKQASGRSRMCAKCNYAKPICTPAMMDICRKAFVAGYIKGNKDKR